MISCLHSLMPVLPSLFNHSTASSRDPLNSHTTSNSGIQLSSLLQLPSLLLIFADLNSRLNSNSSCLRCLLYSLGAAPTENTTFCIVARWFTAAEMCLQHRWVATRLARTRENTAPTILLLLGVVAETCLPISCLAMDVSSDFTIPAFGRHYNCRYYWWP
jgi:hypothetical protein